LITSGWLCFTRLSPDQSHEPPPDEIREVQITFDLERVEDFPSSRTAGFAHPVCR